MKEKSNFVEKKKYPQIFDVFEILQTTFLLIEATRLGSLQFFFSFK